MDNNTIEFKSFNKISRMNKFNFFLILIILFNIFSNQSFADDNFKLFLNNFLKEKVSKKYNQTEFVTTFSTTEGIMSQFDDKNNLIDISAWGVASGIIKIKNKLTTVPRIVNINLMVYTIRN